jgi:hypothetical protein
MTTTRLNVDRLPVVSRNIPVLTNRPGTDLAHRPFSASSALAIVETVGMPPQWGPLATAAATVLAALVGGTLGGVIAQRHEGRRWTRDQRMKAYADLIESYAAVYQQLAAFDSNGHRVRPDWSDWTRSLAVVYVVADSSVAGQARKIDAAMYMMHIHAGQQRIPSAEWVALREPLEREVLDFVNVARAELGSTGEPLSALWGRPANHPSE